MVSGPVEAAWEHRVELVEGCSPVAGGEGAAGGSPGLVDAEISTAKVESGDLLPEDLGEPWLEEPRDRLRLRVGQLLRGAHRSEDLLRVDPMDEQAHVELLREAVVGDRTTALRRYARMERVLQEELGISPGPEAIAPRRRVVMADAEPSPAWPVDVMATPPTAHLTDPLERDAELHELTRAGLRSWPDC
jgi:hypothetical protein